MKSKKSNIPEKFKRNKIKDIKKGNKNSALKTANYYPEFTTNKSIKKYIEQKLNDDKSDNNNYDKTIKISKFKKDKRNTLSNEKTLKNKSAFCKHLHYSEPNIQKNGGNYDDLNNNNNLYNNNYNIFNVDNSNEYLNRDISCYREINSKQNGIINNNNNYYYNNNSLTNNGINNNVIIFSKKHLINKINAPFNNRIIKNRIDKNNFNNNYYNNENIENNEINEINEINENNEKNKSYNNLLEGNNIYNAIKNLEKFKIQKKNLTISENIDISQDKNKNKSHSLTFRKNFSKNNKDKINNIYENPILPINKLNNKSFKKTGKKQQQINNNKIENGLNPKEDRNIVKHIIKTIFKNAEKFEKKLNEQNKEQNKKLYSPLLNKYKKGNFIINNNTSIVKCEYSNRDKFFFEYQNHIKNK